MRISRAMFSYNTEHTVSYAVDLLKDYDVSLVEEFYESVFSFMEKYSIRECSDLNVLFENWQLSTILAIEMHLETRCVIDMPLVGLPIRYKNYHSSQLSNQLWLYHLVLDTKHFIPSHVLVSGRNIYSAEPFDGYAVVGHGSKVKIISSSDNILNKGTKVPNIVRRMYELS